MSLTNWLTVILLVVAWSAACFGLGVSLADWLRKGDRS